MRTILILLIAFSFSAAAQAGNFTGRVVGVHDGDTITVLTSDLRQVKVRLADIDAPELRQPFGYRAKQALSDLVYGSDVQIEDQGSDRYGRTIGVVYAHGSDVQHILVQEGFAWSYTAYQHDAVIPQLESDARAAHRGLWADPHPVEPWLWRKVRRVGSGSRF